MVLVSDSGKPIYVNDAACGFLGTTRDRFVATGLGGLIHEVDRLRDPLAVIAARHFSSAIGV